jgi:hypothetical protein
MPSKDGMQPMQMQTKAKSDGGLSNKPIIIVLSAVILGLLALVIGGGVAVYKVIQTHHVNSATLQQLSEVEQTLQQLKDEQKTLMNALIDTEKDLEAADFKGDSITAEKKEEAMENLLDAVIGVEDEIEEEEHVQDEIEDELHFEDKKKKANKNDAGESVEVEPIDKEALSKKVDAEQEKIAIKDQERKEEFPEILANEKVIEKKPKIRANKNKKKSNNNNNKNKNKNKNKNNQEKDNRLLRRRD